MKIDISKLRDGEILELEHTYDPKELNLELYDLRYLTPLSLKGTLERVKNSLFLKGFLTTRIEVLCTRCLKAVRQQQKEPVDFYYLVKETDEFIETTDEIRGVMLLSYPSKFLCVETCKGLCPQCGVNLNTESCCCRGEKSGISNKPFEKLSEWYKKRRGKSS